MVWVTEVTVARELGWLPALLHNHLLCSLHMDRAGEQMSAIAELYLLQNCSPKQLVEAPAMVPGAPKYLQSPDLVSHSGDSIVCVVKLKWKWRWSTSSDTHGRKHHF